MGFKASISSGGGIVYPIAYVRNGWNVVNFLNNTHDLGWYLANEPAKFTYSIVGITPLLDIDNDTKLLTDNFFSNKDRVTNSLGLTATYDGSNGEIADYAIDHYTGLGYYLQNAVPVNVDFINSATQLRAATLATFSDWRMMTVKDAANIVINNGASPSHIFASIQSWSTDFTWVMNSVNVGFGLFWRLNQHISSSLWMISREINNPNTSVMTIGVRNHF